MSFPSLWFLGIDGIEPSIHFSLDDLARDLKHLEIFVREACFWDVIREESDARMEAWSFLRDMFSIVEDFGSKDAEWLLKFSSSFLEKVGIISSLPAADMALIFLLIPSFNRVEETTRENLVVVVPTKLIPRW
jgi:hypothetical protein